MASLRKGTIAFLSGRTAQQTLLKAALVCAMTFIAAHAICFSSPGCQPKGFARQHLAVPARLSSLVPRPPSFFLPWVFVGCAFFVRRTRLQAADRDFEMEQAKLRIEQVLHEKQCLEEEKQKVSDTMKPLKKTIVDLRSELKASQQQLSESLQASRQKSDHLREVQEKIRLLEQERSEALSQNTALRQTLKVLEKDLQDYQQKTADHGLEKEQASSGLQEIQEKCRLLEQEKSEALTQNTALRQTLKVLENDLRDYQQKAAAHGLEKEQASSRLQEVQAAAQGLERDKDAALARVRALEKSLEDTAKDVATSNQSLQSTRQAEQKAFAAFDDVAAERDALKLQVQDLKDTMSNIMCLATGKLTDPDDDPFVLLERTKKEAALLELQAKELDEQTQNAVAQKDEALAELELRSKSLESLELRSRSLEDSGERAQLLSKLLQEVAATLGASPGIFGLFQSKKTDEEVAEDIKTKIKELMQRR